MKDYSDDFIAALRSGDVIDVGAVAIYCAPTPVLIWGGYGEIVLDGEAYQGIGDKGLVTVTGGAIGGASQNIELSLSGIDPATLSVFDATTLRDVPVKIWRLGFDGSGAVNLDASVFARGKLDQVPRDDDADGTATLRGLVETAAMGMGQSSGRRRSDADQRLISPTDGSFKAVSYAGTKSLYWGGEKPKQLSSALPNLTAVSGTRAA